MTNWKLLLLKLGSLFSFVGAPMFFADAMEPALGKKMAFGVGFVPLLVIIFAVLAIVDGDELSRPVLFLVRTAQLMAIMIILANVVVLAALALGTQYPNVGLATLGCGVGTIASLYFLSMSKKYLQLPIAR